MHDKCENSSLCHLCDGVSMYKNRFEEQQEKERNRQLKKQAERQAAFRTHKKEKKEGMAFEKDVQDKWNAAFQASGEEEVLFRRPEKKQRIQKPRLGYEEPVVESTALPTFSVPKKKSPPAFEKKDAVRQRNSGALWYAKGDIKTEDYLMECKERGTVNSRGEKSITIPKEWLVKQELEAFQENRPYWIVPFRYKNDESIYLVKTFDQEIEMYQELRRLRQENLSLREKSDGAV